MSELNINDLPEEMLITVFRLLDAANLNNATLTCKLWKNLIESVCRWSLTLQLEYYAENRFSIEQSLIDVVQRGPDAEKIKSRAEQKMNFILTTNRKFETITIFGGRLKEGGQLLQIFRKHGFHVFNLRMRRVHIYNFIALTEQLNFTPNLKYFNIELQTLQDVSDVPDYVLPDLRKLTNLEMSVVDYRWIQCFQNTKLTTIQIYEYEYTKHRRTRAPFVLSQVMLTSLTVESHADSSSVLAKMGELDVPIPFRLTQLAISDLGARSSTHDHNLLKFVESQASSLTEMEIGDGIPSSVYECVFASMTKLNTLGVVLGHIPLDNDFYDRLQENGSVCTMKILTTELESLYDIHYFGSFLKKLPNIRNLLLSNSGCMYENILVVAAQNLSKVEFLYLRFIGKCLFDHIGSVNFTNLNTLHIQILESRINWYRFTKIHTRLVNLTIEEMDEKSFLTSDDIDEITTNVDLQNLKLGVGFVADDRFFEIIRMKCPNLKVLDLHKSCVPHEINCYKEKNLLRLCDVLDCLTYSQMLYDPYRNDLL